MRRCCVLCLFALVALSMAATPQFQQAVKVMPTSFRTPTKELWVSKTFSFPAVPPKSGHAIVLRADVRLATSITALSGKYRMTCEKKTVVRGYDNRAQRSAAMEMNFVISGGAGEWLFDVKLKDWCEMAIIVDGDICSIID